MVVDRVRCVSVGADDAGRLQGWSDGASDLLRALLGLGAR